MRRPSRRSRQWRIVQGVGMAASFPPVTELLPHRAPMLLVSEVIRATDDGVTCTAVVGEDFPFLRNGEADISVCVELIAQAAGCCVGLADLREGRSPQP